MKKLYNEYKKVIEEAGEIKKAYFTTFNLSLDFFETYILPPILDIDIPTNEFEYENINEALEKYKKNIDIKVFYDFSALNLQDKKRTIIELTPIFVENGFFHPKVIYIEGNKKSFLIVGSNNLTLSGWGRNLESFFIVEVDKNLKKQIDYFFKNIKNINKLNLYKYDFENKYNFLFNHEIKTLLKEKEVIIFSPYFSDIEEMIKELNIKKCYIVPDIKNGKIRLKKIPKNINFYCFNKLDVDRFNHSKVFVTKTHLIIGSYNFTHQAINNNIESAIVIKGDFFDEFKKNLELVNVNSMDEKELKIEEEIFEKRFNIGVNLSFDYDKLSFNCEFFNIQTINNMKIYLPPNIKKPLSKNIQLDNNEIALFLRSVVKNKIFRIYKNSTLKFEGIINEINTKNNRTIYKIETFEDIFYSFIEKEPTKAKKTYEKYISQNLDSEIIENSTNNENIINYFSLFSGINKLREKLLSLNTIQQFIQFGYRDANSLNNIKIVFEENKDKLSKTMQYIFVYELNGLIREYNNQISKIQKEKNYIIDEIKYKKNKKIEKILETIK